VKAFWFFVGGSLSFDVLLIGHFSKSDISDLENPVIKIIAFPSYHP
jgi:hypothetical protein